jgi:uncharacterized protein (TIGR03435 family)
VLDRTGFAGSFKVRLEFAPVAPGGDTTTQNFPYSPPLRSNWDFDLIHKKGSEEVLVVDQVERHPEN